MRVRKGMGAMTTDNRTNEPTPEQIEAAAQAVREVDARAGLIADVDLPMYRARAALEAAEIARRKFHPFGPVAMRRGFTESER